MSQIKMEWGIWIRDVISGWRGGRVFTYQAGGVKGRILVRMVTQSGWWSRVPSGRHHFDWLSTGLYRNYTFVWPTCYPGTVKRWGVRCHQEYNKHFEQDLPGWSRSCQCEWTLQWGPAPPLVGRGRRGDTGSGSHEFAPTQRGANWPERGPR